MGNLYQRMTETLATNMGDTLVVNHQFKEAITRITELEKENDSLREALITESEYQLGNYGEVAPWITKALGVQ